jgi:predicted metal-dependent enzyme (double-stranded beta helix superfamily)
LYTKIHGDKTPKDGRLEVLLVGMSLSGGRDRTTIVVPAPGADRLRGISKSSTRSALPQAAHFLSRLVKDPGFVRGEILPLLEEAGAAEGWYVDRRYDDGDGLYSLQIFVWPPGSRTRVHDHSSWGAYCCAVGTVLEERYERLDDGSVSGLARLEKVWQLSWSSAAGASTVQPGDGGIHRVGNPGDETAISVHLYGPRTEAVDGRDYDPSRDYVCDRT